MDRSAEISASSRHRTLSGTVTTGPDSALGLQELYLHAGQTCSSRDPLLLSMILGSCVAVCLFDHRLRMGGATHFLLPEWQHTSGEPSSRYGDVAIHNLVAQLTNLGCQTAHLTAKVFGGACMFQSPHDGRTHIGDRNTAIAIETLFHLSIFVTAKDVGGERGRKIRLWTSTGDVMLELVGG